MLRPDRHRWRISAGSRRPRISGCTGSPLGAYREDMGRTVLTVLGVLLAIWLVVTMIGLIISTLKFFFYVGFVVLVIMAVVALIGRASKSK
jgi:hypothetical protein